MDKRYVGRKRSLELGRGYSVCGSVVDRVLRTERTAQMMKVDKKHIKLSNMLCRPEERIIRSEVAIGKLKEEVITFKRRVVDVSGLHSESNLYTLEFHLLDHIAEDLRRFGTLSVLDASRRNIKCAHEVCM